MPLNDWLWILGGAGLAVITGVALLAWSRAELRERRAAHGGPPPTDPEVPPPAL
jgi:hypothetical protein